MTPDRMDEGAIGRAYAHGHSQVTCIGKGKKIRRTVAGDGVYTASFCRPWCCVQEQRDIAGYV